MTFFDPLEKFNNRQWNRGGLPWTRTKFVGWVPSGRFRRFGLGRWLLLSSRTLFETSSGPGFRFFALYLFLKKDVINFKLLKNPKVDDVVAAIAQDFGLQFSYEFMYDECQSSIALNSMVNDRYNDSTPCYDAYVGLTCDNAYNPAAPIFKVHKTSPCTFLTFSLCVLFGMRGN